MGDFNPRFPWGKRPVASAYVAKSGIFQSTLPVGEATPIRRLDTQPTEEFQSTLPVGEATRRVCLCGKVGHISIHASRGGSDSYSPVGYSADGRISIHASRGGSDPGPRQCNGPDGYFNPRFPWGKRHGQLYTDSRDVAISIHASRGGSDDV